MNTSTSARVRRTIAVSLLLLALLATSASLVSAQTGDEPDGAAAPGATLYLPVIQSDTPDNMQATTRPDAAPVTGSSALFLPAVQVDAQGD